MIDLDGVPHLQRLGKVNVGQTVPEQLRLDLEVENVRAPPRSHRIDAVAPGRELVLLGLRVAQTLDQLRAQQ